MSKLPPHWRYDAFGKAYEHEKRTLRGLDPGIAHAVYALRACAVETFESCEGGSGHASNEPLVRFHGTAQEGIRALGCALVHHLHPAELRRVWNVHDGEPTGPVWEMTFGRKF